ncbi:MAG: hypothetical protein ACFBSE_00300 [Prochloraceae cyanobacterium]
MPGQSQLSKSKIEKTLVRKVKKVVSEKGIDVATRKGTKELNMLAKNICSKHKNIEELEKIGAELGEQIVAASEKRNKKFLDRGVVRLTAGSSYVKSLLGIAAKQKPAENNNTEETPATEAPPEEQAQQTEPEQNQE